MERRRKKKSLRDKEALACLRAAVDRRAADPPPHDATICQKLVVPAYFTVESEWGPAEASTPEPSTMILGVTSTGPGSAPNASLQAYVTQAQAKGITILGYVATSCLLYTSLMAAVVAVAAGGGLTAAHWSELPQLASYAILGAALFLALAVQAFGLRAFIVAAVSVRCV